MSTGPAPFGRNGHPARPQPVEHVSRLVAFALDPGGRAPRRGVRTLPVPVAAPDRDRRGIPGQPPGQRQVPAQVEPAPVPDLEQRRAAAHRAGPAQRPGERVVDRQQPARRLGRVQPGVRLLAEVDPAHVAQCAGVSAVGRHLLAGQQDDPVPPRRGGQLGVVADRVVVGDGEKIEPAPGREHGQLGNGQLAVRVHGVRVQVAGRPSARPGPGPAGGPGAAAAPPGDGGASEAGGRPSEGPSEELSVAVTR